MRRKKDVNTPPKNIHYALEPTAKIQFETINIPTQYGHEGFPHIVFTNNRRVAVLSNSNEIFFSPDSGETWELVRKYNSNTKNTFLQSLAIHPTKDYIFIGARFYNGRNIYPRHLIIKRDESGKWGDHTHLPFTQTIKEQKLEMLLKK